MTSSSVVTLTAIVAVGAVAGLFSAQPGRPRARDLGIQPGAGSPGPLNAITDVAGVRVGHTTIVQGTNIRTGVTAILPHAGNLFREKVAGAVFVGNAFGKLAGSTQVQELGTIETPIVLTNTLSVGTAVDSVARWTIAQPGNENVRSVNALVGETNDGGLNDIRGFHISRDHVLAAIAAARDGAVEEGAVGAGTGTSAFGWKGGIGTSSRRVRSAIEDASTRSGSARAESRGEWIVGVLVQTNYGGRLTIAGVPIWREINPRAPGPSGFRAPGPADFRAPGPPGFRAPESSADGSCMIIVATDAPLDARNLERLAARAIFAMARTGSTYSNGSGDFAIAFSTHPSLRVTGAAVPQSRTILPTDGVSALFEAVLDATEEAIYNSMLKAVDTTANGRTVSALPIDAVKEALKKYGR